MIESGCDIGDEGATAMASVFRENSAIKSFDWHGPRLRLQSEFAFRSLDRTTVRVTGNGVGNEGAKALADALADNASLAHIDLSRKP